MLVFMCCCWCCQLVHGYAPPVWAPAFGACVTMRRLCVPLPLVHGYAPPVCAPAIGAWETMRRLCVLLPVVERCSKRVIEGDEIRVRLNFLYAQCDMES